MNNSPMFWPQFPGQYLLIATCQAHATWASFFITQTEKSTTHMDEGSSQMHNKEYEIACLTCQPEAKLLIYLYLQILNWIKGWRVKHAKISCKFMVATLLAFYFWFKFLIILFKKGTSFLLFLHKQPFKVLLQSFSIC